MRGIKNSWLFLLLLILLIPSTSDRASLSTFDLTILGTNPVYGFGGPCPPGLTEPCTWDAFYHPRLYLRLTYNGTEICNITKLILWHEITVRGITYNQSGPINIQIPSYLMKTGYFYDFDVTGSFYPDYTVSLEITTLDLGVFVISTAVIFQLSVFSSWEPKYPNESRITFDSGDLAVVMLSLGTLLLYKRFKRQKELRKCEKHLIV